MAIAKVEYRFPSGADKRQQLLHQVGKDGWGLRASIEADSQNHWMLSIPAVDTDASCVETKLLACGRGGNLDC
jgi:hypothetical protein